MPRQPQSNRDVKSRPAKSQPAAHVLEDVAAFRESLWKTLERNCEGLSGADVINALKVTSDDIYHAGIDEAYVEAPVKEQRNLADAWDLTWVTALSVDLMRRQQALRKIRSRTTSRKAR